MILLSNSTTQTVQPGEAITFDLERFKSGCCECHRQGSSAIKLKKCGVYELMFTGNVGGAAVGTVQLQMEAGGEVLPETTIIVTDDTVGSLDNVAAHTFFRNCCGDYDRITIVNTGTVAAVIDANSAFTAKRLG